MIRRTIILATVAALAAACGDGSGPASAPRTFLMVFSAIPPRLDSTDVIIAIDDWAPHADAAIMHVSPPWAAMLGGATPDSAVRTDELPLANYYRGKGLGIVFTVDATDGLNRAAEAPELVSAGRSITDTMVKRLYREWVFAVANRIRPDYLGLAARDQSHPSVGARFRVSGGRHDDQCGRGAAFRAEISEQPVCERTGPDSVGPAERTISRNSAGPRRFPIR